ncbi:SusC/RagA family TonB-linked outer membrane protein [Olivibacter domesticus]|uniref:TonB-linked outer membrane protein, SusC/RagA family n=1 Tax=Olivibacter domesticus TaxID=407022 RepID=A0A1H7XJE5_OLID1|nr:TonB-dependent receptor [Olivibacter domesticus]SEM33900.1 TonB-linked outer membrane protein, SusC/RagA family [Olivibacter domesticus]
MTNLRKQPIKNMVFTSGLALALTIGGPFFEDAAFASAYFETSQTRVKTERQKRIAGVVTSAKDQGPLPGVSVLIKGSTKGVTTDGNGRFNIEASPNDVLVFSYIGHLSAEQPVGDRTVINISLREESNNLEEVVVVGYGTQKRNEINSAVSNVKAEDFNAGGSRSPMDLIQGKVAGLNITRTQGNNPNSSASIQLRGINSLKGGTMPLVVIDGIPGGNLDLIQQDDIETFSVLKDGSAAAIYGTRGNAGVILITTKKGKAGDPRYDYSTYLQHEAVDRKPDYLSATDFRDLINQGVINQDQDLGGSTDLYDELINKDNLSQYHNFAASGGSEKTNYRASLYYNDAQGIAKRNDREQFGGRINVNQKGLQDRLSLQLNLAANMNKADLLGGGVNDDVNAAEYGTTTGSDFEQAIQRNPTAPLRNPDGTFLETQGYNNYNPVARLENRIFERDQSTFSGDATFTLDIIEGLKASAFGSYVRNQYNDRRYRSVNDWDQRQDSEYQGMGYAAKYNFLSWTRTFESTIDYTKVIADDHSINATAGYSYQYSTIEKFNVNNNGFTTDATLDWDLGGGSAINNTLLPRPGMGSFKDDNTLVAFFGRVNYSYLGKYSAQVILRHEGSSRFGANHKWGNFPAASLGWTLSEEEFIKNIPVINNLKLRAGYGVTGNQDIANYQSLLTLGTGGVYPQNSVYYQTFGPSRNANPDLRWEKKTEWNFGLDFALLESRISGSIDVYNRLTKDLLYDYNAQQPGFIRDKILTNVGSISNKGVEILLSGSPIKTEQFNWTIDLTGSIQNNRLDKLSSDVFQANFLEFGGLPSPGNLGNAIRLEEGGKVGNFYGKRFAGFTDDGKWLFYKADGSTGTASEINANDLTIIGNGVPKYNLALSNRFTYKNFDLTIFLRGKFGFDILNTKEMYFGNKKWLPNNIFKSAITTHNQLDDDPQYSDYYIEKGDFVKIDNITLGYNFKLNTKYIRNLRVYATGRNIATFTGYDGIDPELQDTGFTTGIDGRGFYPRTRSWTLGLNIGF